MTILHGCGTHHIWLHDASKGALGGEICLQLFDNLPLACSTCPSVLNVCYITSQVILIQEQLSKNRIIIDTDSHNEVSIICNLTIMRSSPASHTTTFTNSHYK